MVFETCLMDIPQRLRPPLTVHVIKGLLSIIYNLPFRLRHNFQQRVNEQVFYDKEIVIYHLIVWCLGLEDSIIQPNNKNIWRLKIDR